MNKPLKQPFPKIDGYLIEGVLGRGATGVVYSAVQLAVDRPVAVKVLHTQLMGSKSAVRRLQREARTAARLAHPGIISAIDMGEQDGLWWYAMELVEGISLGERLDERGPLSEREALRFFLPLVEALQHAFEAGVVHRDIKPSNILIDTHGKARLVDLGLAFAEDDPMVTKPGGTLGTPHYISPEQARDPSAADTRSDLWSLGATMYHAVCARPPFQGESVAEILSGVLYQRVPDPRLLAPELSKGFSLVLRKCLSREPGGRYQTPFELQEDLERLVERRAPEIRTASLDPVDDGRPEWMQHWPWIVGGAAALLLGLALWAPWAGDEPSDVELVPAIVTWPSLELLEERYAAGGLTLAVAGGRFAELGAAPDGAEGLAAAFRNRLKLDLDAAVSAVAQDFEDAVNVELRILDLVSAQKQLGELAPMLEARTGYPAVDVLPAGPSRQVLARTLQRLEVQFSQKSESARRRAGEDLNKYLTRTLIPGVEAARDAFRWKDARALLDTRSEWLVQAGVESKLLPEDEERLLDDGKARLVSVTNTLFPHYKSTVDSLQRFLQADHDELREKVERGSLGAAAELSARFEAELTQREVHRDQVPVEYQTIEPLEGNLKELFEELRDYEARLLEADASEDYAVDLLQVDGLLRSRRYDAALALWDDRLGDPWRSSVHAAIGQRRREAELLEGLLIQVAKAVRVRHDKRLEITLGDIMHRARVIATRTPERIVEEGFEVVLPDLEQPVAITLRATGAAGDEVETLPTKTLIALSGLRPKEVALDGFLVALFLHYEGRHEEARDHLPGGPFEETVLLAPLQQRIEAALAEQAEADRDRLDGKDRLLRRLQRDVRDGRSTPENMLGSGELLLASYRDLLTPDEVLEVEGICVDCRRRLRAPSVGEAFPAAAIDKHFSGIVTLTWDFERSGGTWHLGDWFGWDDEGVVRMTVPRETQEDFWDRDRALRLPLGRPLAVDQEFELTLTLAWADEHGDDFDNDVVLSVAGAHLLFVDGPTGRPNRWAVTRGDPRDALEKLRLDADPRFDGFTGFSRDVPFEVRLKLASSQGRMQVWVDGVELEMPKEPQRASAPKQPELVLYSKYLLEASRVVLKARLRE